MKIGITLKHNAYTPEAYAYQQYLVGYGYDVQLDFNLDNNNDINIYFMGLRPFWSNKNGKAFEIHEYQSLSTPPYSYAKNKLKRIINKKPVGRIFLNNDVKKCFSFNDNIPYIKRDMGVDEILFQKPKLNPDFDILYSGSVSGRVGLIENLVKLAKNYKLIVVGQVEGIEKEYLTNKNITLTGRVNRHELPEIYSNVRYGLNYTPDLYPFNIQTSTKTLEYLAAGLGVISNRYQWIEEFCDKLNYEPIWLEDLNETEINLINNNLPDMSEYSWNNILKNSKFENFIKGFK